MQVPRQVDGRSDGGKRGSGRHLRRGFYSEMYVISAVQPVKPKAERKAEKQEPSPKAFLFCSLRYTRQVIKELLVALIRSGFIQKALNTRQRVLNV